jgi:2-polyprenyl-3-methyl-5-hydroxy-6-metoxy-1,4-benzoquinol methylase
MSPLANSYVAVAEAERAEKFYPLHAYVCEQCLLVQLQQFESPSEIFSDYAYFSSYSDSWLKHAETYAAMASQRFGLGPQSQVIEIASNDGYLLQYFKAKGIPVLGVEPAANVAAVAEQKGIRSLVKFFSTDTASGLKASGSQADLLIGNNVLAHVPELNDFVAGLKVALKPEGVVTMEFPHLLSLMEQNQFDTIYHEHFSYFSFLTVQRIFAHHGLRLFDVDRLSTHGGSLRIYGTHAENARFAQEERVAALLSAERQAGLAELGSYAGFAEQVRKTKRNLLSFLIRSKDEGRRVAAYGAPAKGNTLLNYCGVRTDLIDFTVDRSPHKQDKLLPGTRIPIYAPERVFEQKPDYLLLLPWNLKTEIMGQMAGIREWGGRFVVPVPTLEVLE